MNTLDNHAESDFDDLLDRLTNELAMTPTTRAEVAMIPDVEPEPTVESEPIAAPAQARSSWGFDPKVKIIAILTGSLTIVAVAALVVLGQPERSAVAASTNDAPAPIERPSAEATEPDHELDAVPEVPEPDSGAVAEVIEPEPQPVAVVEASEPEPVVEAKPKPRKRKRKRSAKPAAAKPVVDDFDDL